MRPANIVDVDHREDHQASGPESRGARTTSTSIPPPVDRGCSKEQDAVSVGTPQRWMEQRGARNLPADRE